MDFSGSMHAWPIDGYVPLVFEKLLHRVSETLQSFAQRFRDLTDHQPTRRCRCRLVPTFNIRTAAEWKFSAALWRPAHGDRQRTADESKHGRRRAAEWQLESPSCYERSTEERDIFAQPI